ncbi:hypothetical protein [Actinocrispum wychmicini]|nr:hypothetical protein [Actinocrispum wychmicini]
MPALLKVAYELFGPIVEFFASAAKLLTWFLTHMFLPKTWARVAAFLFGTVLVVSGVFVFFTGSSPVRKVTGVLP